MNKKILLIGLFGVFLVYAFSYSVTPATTWVSPATNNSNFTSDISIIISFINVTDMLNPIAANTTLYYNRSGFKTWQNVSFSNSTVFSGWTISGTGAATELLNITATLSIAGLADSHGDIWFNVTIGNATYQNITDSNAYLINLTIDDTAPYIVTANFTNATHGSNHSYAYTSTSGYLLVNVTVGNVSTGANVANADNVGVVLINITGPNGVQNTTFVTRENGVFWWNNTINVSYLPEGKNNITIQVNDTYGNSRTAVSTITIDNVVPTIAFTCADSSIVKGGTATCTCTGAANSNIETNSFGAQTTNTLNNAGTYTETCTVTSFVGLSTSTTVSYSVVNSLTSGGSVATGGATTAIVWSATHNIDDATFEAGVIKELAPKERVKVTAGGGTHHVGVKSITATSATIEIASDPVTVTLDIGEEVKVDVDENGTYDIYVKLNGITNGKADVLIKGLSEVIPEGEEGTVSTTGEIEEQPSDDGEGMNKTWIYVLVIAILVIIGIAIGVKKK